MSVDITFLGHSGFILDADGKSLVIDPFLTGNPLAKHQPGDIQCDYIALTHGHEDHFGDTLELAKTNKATVIAAYEITNFLGSQGVENVEPANPGGKVGTDFGWVAFTQAFHSSSYKGQYMGMPCGLMVNMGGVTIYHCGDTGIFGDMKLLGDIYKPDIAFIPTGDRFTMGPELATRAAEMIRPKVAVPIHYATFPIILPDASGFAPSGVEVKIMQPGERWRYK